MAKKRKKTLGCLFWVALALIVVVVFLLNQKSIGEILQKTGFSDLFRKKSDDPLKVTITTEEEPDSTETPTEVVIKPPDPRENLVDSREDEEVPNETVSNANESPPPESEEIRPNTRYASIYFVQVGEDGEISLKPVVRPVYFDDSPLRETLNALLEGQNSQERERGLQTQIPSDSRILAVYIENQTAFIDFSESFRYNPLGRVGLEAQVKQVVYTTLEFSNIRDVQILIDGKQLRYLGPEGLYIGEPLTKDSFG